VGAAFSRDEHDFNAEAERSRGGEKTCFFGLNPEPDFDVLCGLCALSASALNKDFPGGVQPR
jgi:hypothetical protein